MSISGCGPGLSSSPPDEVRIGVDSASTPLAEGLINAYEGQHPETPFSLIPDSRESLLKSIDSGELEAAIMLGSPSERAFFATPIALELIVIITDHDNPIEDISLDALRSILTGHFSDWSSVGGPPMPIVLMTPPDGSSTRLYLENSLLKPDGVASVARQISDERTLVQSVASTPGSLSYVPFSSLTPDAKPLTLDGTPPSPLLARQESYPLLAQIVFISREEPEDFMHSFLGWIVSAEGQQVVRRFMLGYND